MVTERALSDDVGQGYQTPSSGTSPTESTRAPGELGTAAEGDGAVKALSSRGGVRQAGRGDAIREAAPRLRGRAGCHAGPGESAGAPARGGDQATWRWGDSAGGPASRSRPR